MAFSTRGNAVLSGEKPHSIGAEPGAELTGDSMPKMVCRKLSCASACIEAAANMRDTRITGHLRDTVKALAAMRICSISNFKQPAVKKRSRHRSADAKRVRLPRAITRRTRQRPLQAELVTKLAVHGALYSRGRAQALVREGRPRVKRTGQIEMPVMEFHDRKVA